jgi:hypothetical protein
MTGPKIKTITPPPMTRAALESFIWAATGWRGDAKVIDSILEKIDAHVAVKIAEVDTAPAEIDYANARIVEISAELNGERAALHESLATIKKLSGELHELGGRSAAPTVDRTTVAEILELLATAATAVNSSVDNTIRTFNAITAISGALQSADGLVKDIQLSDAIAERRADPEFMGRIAQTMEQNAAALKRLADTPAEQLKLEVVTEGDAVVAKALDAQPLTAVVSTAHIDQAEADRLMEAEAAEVEAAEVEAEQPQAAPVLEIRIPVEPGPTETDGDAPVDEDEDEDPEMAAMIAEIEAAILSEGRGVACTKCGNVKVWENYYKDKRAANGHKGACKSCEAKQAKEVAKAAREAKLAADAEAAPVAETTVEPEPVAQAVEV